MCSEGLQSHSKWASRRARGETQAPSHSSRLLPPWQLLLWPIMLFFLLFIHSVDKLGQRSASGARVLPSGQPANLWDTDILQLRDLELFVKVCKREGERASREGGGGEGKRGQELASKGPAEQERSLGELHAVHSLAIPHLVELQSRSFKINSAFISQNLLELVGEGWSECSLKKMAESGKRKPRRLWVRWARASEVWIHGRSWERRKEL